MKMRAEFMNTDSILRETFNHNRFQEKFESGGVAIGAVAKTQSPTLIEVYGDIGLDFVYLDFEHSGPTVTDSEHLEHIMRAAALSGIEPLVRAPTDPSQIRKILDTGVRNIMVPQIGTADEVKRAIKAARFVYEGMPGDRGIGGGRANNWETGMEEDNYLQREDESTLIGVIIETREALDNVESILSVDELGFISIGYHDLAHALGYGLKNRHQAVQEKAEEIKELCRAKDVPYGIATRDMTEARSAVDSGCQFLQIGYEFHAVRADFGKWVGEFNQSNK